MSIKALKSQRQHKNNCFSLKAKFKLFSRQTSLHQNVKHLVGFKNETKMILKLLIYKLFGWE